MMKRWIPLLLLTVVPVTVLGWSEYTHCRMAAVAIERVKAADAAGDYMMIYNTWGAPTYYTNRRDGTQTDPQITDNSQPGFQDHPAVQGAWSEDAGSSARTNYLLTGSAQSVLTNRDYRHFGGESIGLKWEDYFALRSGTVKPSQPNYLSARDWAKSDGAAHAQAGESGDKMNFEGAIDAYNFYTPEGRKESFVRLGHVLHLLQDQAQADHAVRTAHPGSAKNDEDAAALFYKCECLAEHTFEIGSAACVVGCLPSAGFLGIGYLICLGPCEAAVAAASAVAYGSCEASTDPNELGFEALIREHWTFTNHYYNAPGIGLNLPVVREASFDAYFKSVADYGIQATASRNLEVPLGLGSMLVGPIGSALVGAGISAWQTLPALDPDIDYPEDARPYLELADDVIAHATSRCAGMLMDFYDIVNYPPFIRSVLVVQGANGLTPKGILNQSQPATRIYAGAWVDETVMETSYQRTTGRKLVVSDDHPINLTQRIYVLAEIADDMAQMRLGSMAMTKATVGAKTYFVTDFLPSELTGSLSSTCEDIVMGFAGADAEPHFAARNYSGNVLDSRPETLATAAGLAPHNWSGYEPGIDLNHRFRYIAPDAFEAPTNNNTRLTATSLAQAPSGGSIGSLVGIQFSNLTIHDASDIDFFELQLPARIQANLDCLNAPQLGDNVYRIDGKLVLIISTVNALGGQQITFGEPVVTFYSPTGTPLTPSQTGLVTAPGSAMATISESDLDTFFPNGRLIFSVTAQAGERLCYEMTARHNWCLLLLDPPELLYDIPGIRVPWWVDLPSDPFPFGVGGGSPLPPLPFPSDPMNMRIVQEGGLPDNEFMVLNIPEAVRFTMNAGITTSSGAGALDLQLLDASGTPLANAEIVGVQWNSETDGSLTVQKEIWVPMLAAGTYLLEINGADVPGLLDLTFILLPITPNLWMEWVSGQSAVRLIWSAEYQGFLLMRANAPAGPYLPAGDPPVIYEDRHEVTVPIEPSPADAQYFRLEQ